jgi:hypothetical protein
MCGNVLLCLDFGSGLELLRDPRYNKGLAFTDQERDAHYLRGLLPPAHLTQDKQVLFTFAMLVIKMPFTLLEGIV